MVLAIQLMEPGTVLVIQDSRVQVFHKGSVIRSILFLAYYMVEQCRSVDGFCQGPVHSVVHYRVSVPVGGVCNAGSTVTVPGVSDGPFI